MQFIRELHTPLPGNGTCVAIGNFDGLHLGHQAIINKLVNKSKEVGLPSVVLTFAPSPKQYFQGPDHKRIMRFQEKLAMLRAMGVDRVVALRFNQELAQCSAGEFLKKFLVKNCRMQYLYVGEDFQFGKGREGDVAFLESYSKLYQYKIEPVAAVTQAGCRISSTLIRSWLLQGDLRLISEALGRPYSMTAKVGHGDKRGRLLGFPTANIKPGNLCLPKFGVYAVEVTLEDGSTLPGVCNLGVRPTVDGRHLVIETHLIKFDSDIYGKKIKVEFLKHLRDEKKFDSIETLKRQIEQDVNHATVCMNP